MGPGVGTEAEETAGPDREARPGGGRSRRFDLEAVLLLLTMAWAAGIASYPLTDNSFLTHLATGRLILDRGSVPSTDPYSFTAAGTDWTVQSWLASVLYAAAERAGGVLGLRILVLAIFLAGAVLLWRLSRPCRSLVPRAALVLAALYVVTSVWSERPYMAGVIGLGIVWLALDGAVAPGWLVPLYWVWANSHGSFPLGLALAVAVLVGLRLDHRPTDRARRVLMFSAIGTAAAVIGPLGFRALTFPVTALTKSDQLRLVIEWQPPAYSSLDQRVFLVLALVTVLGVVRQPSWRLALPTVMFLAAAVVAQRNIVMALMVFVPVLAETLPQVGTISVSRRPNLLRAYLALGAVAVVGGIAYSLASPVGSFERYPMHALAWLESSPLDDREIASVDVVGNLLHVLDDESARVFVDDRVDMYPAEVIDDSLSLLRGESDWASVLDDHGIDVVVWSRSQPLRPLLSADPRWRIAFSDTDWSVACRRSSACSALD